MSDVVVALVGEGGNSIYSRLRRLSESSDPSLTPRPEVNAIFTALVRILQRGPHSAAHEIRASPSLLARARYIASAANVGEHHLEAHFAAKIVTCNVGARCKLPTCRVRLLAATAEPFPYVENYVRLVGAECRVFVSALKSVGHVAVVGSGPVPLTGALIAAKLGARVTLIDKDAGATELARGLVRRWEAVGALDEGQVTAVVGDAMDVRFSRTGDKGSVAADCVLVASLVPDTAKAAVARNATGAAWDGLLAVRSAHGLIAVANYQRANRDELQVYMDYVGYVVPCACVEGKSVVGERQPPVAIFPQDVLNSMELYVAQSPEQYGAVKTRAEIIRKCGKGVL